MPDGSNAGKFLLWGANLFSSAGETSNNVQVTLVWGLKKQDLSSCHKTDAECMGDTMWDEDFNLNSPQAQQAILVRLIVHKHTLTYLTSTLHRLSRLYWYVS